MNAVKAKLQVAVLGATGYGGGELLRLLLAHPEVELVLLAGSGSEAKPLASVHPQLRGLCELEISPAPASLDAWPAVDVIFLALPHGVAKDLVPTLPANARVVDLSGDFRLSDAAAVRRYYGMEPADAHWQERFVYGLAENHAGLIAEAKYIANPGCFATAAILALSPLAQRGLIEPRVIIDAKTGSTGAGAKPSAWTHHPERANSLFAYKSYGHQHLPEIQQALAAVAPGWAGKLVLQTHATPLVRGIYATVYASLVAGVDTAQVAEAFATYYAGRSFVRLLDAPPNVNWVRGSNFADLAFAVDGSELTVFAALDNLGKGAAGQAVQNLNLMHGWPETLGLLNAGGTP